MESDAGRLEKRRQAGRRRQNRRGAGNESRDSEQHPSLQSASEADRWRLRNLDEVPDWMKTNKYILTGYRFGYDVVMCVHSLFMVHNETGNIWTHLLGFIAFIVLGTYALANIISDDWLHRVVFLTYVVGNLLCMGCSAFYHTMCCHSQRAMQLTIKMDYFGISSIMTASFLAPIYFLFGCWPWLQAMYVAQVAALGGVTLVAPFVDRFNKEEASALRIALYVIATTSGVVPTVHAVFLFPPTNLVSRSLHTGVLLMFLFYGLGTVIYVSKIPERLYPGRFDIWFNSHQVWHILVFLAALVHFFTCVGVYQRFGGSSEEC